MIEDYASLTCTRSASPLESCGFGVMHCRWQEKTILSAPPIGKALCWGSARLNYGRWLATKCGPAIRIVRMQTRFACKIICDSNISVLSSHLLHVRSTAFISLSLSVLMGPSWAILNPNGQYSRGCWSNTYYSTCAYELTMRTERTCNLLTLATETLLSPQSVERA